MGKRLDEMIDTRELFSRGVEFISAANILQAQPPQVFVRVIPPVAVCQAFGMEAFLKVLAQLERGEPPLEGHILTALFNDLKPSSRRRIERAWRKENEAKFKKINSTGPEWARDFPTTFQKALERSSKGFVDWRYPKPGRRPAFFLHPAQEELRLMILEMDSTLGAKDAARVRINPQTGLAEPKNDGAQLPVRIRVIDGQPAPIDIKFRRRPDPKDRGTGQ
jgi:hypothetical protein